MAINPVNINQLNNVDLNQTNQTSRQQNNVVGDNQVNTSVNDSRIGNNAFQADLAKTSLNKALPNTNLVAKNGAVEDKVEDMASFRNKDAASFIRNQRNAINASAARNGVQPETLAAIMFQENRYYGLDDTYQDAAAKDWVRLEGKGIAAAGFYGQLVATGKGNFEANTFGKAQIRLDNLKKIISEGRLSNLISPQDWNKMDNTQKSVAALKLVLNDNNTADIVGAWAGKVKQDWTQRGGSNLINTPRGEYKLLTSIYSQYSPGSSKVNSNPNLSHNPYSSNNSSINKSGRDAISNYGVIWKALNTNENITGFQSSRLPENLRYNPNEPLEGGNGRLLGN
jgi:hypothetical protein